jgi:hypothetical protein
MIKSSHLHRSLFALAAGAVVLLTTARANDEEGTSTIKFSDPSKPGKLKLSVTNGDIRIRGADAQEITVRSEIKPQTDAPRKDGLRVLSTSSSYSLKEKDNVVTLAYGDSFPMSGGGDFEITVPRNTSVIVNNSFGGDIDIGSVTGNIEIKSLNGEVKLDDVTGAALVETMNGEINVNVHSMSDGNPLSFTSMNGEVNLHLPADAKANVQLRTHNGSILTDFDEKELVTKTAALTPETSSNRNSNGNAEARAAARAGADAAREAARVAREAGRAAREAARNGDGADVDVNVQIPVPPVPPLPPMTGGKVVTGTLNGGGPEVRVSTMNGDVTLRKSVAQK